MKSLDTVIRSVKIKYILLCGIFLLMLLLNFLTYYISDDYIYMNSFATGERIDSILDVFPSIYQHYFSLNGRLVPHFIVQTLLMAPKAVFNFINAFMFCLMLALADKLANPDGKRNNFIFAALFCAFWVFQPAFGQVNLWLDGSVNYLWCACAVGFFTLRFSKRITGKSGPLSPGKTALFALFGFLTGNFSENASSAVIALTFFMLCYMVIKKIKCRDLIIAWLCAWGGFILLALSPAGAERKINSFSIEDLSARFEDTVERISSLSWLLVLYVLLLAVCLAVKADKRRIFISLMYLIGGLFANFVLVFSTYYPERSMCSVTFFVVCALFTLIWELQSGKNFRIFAAAGLVCALFTVFPMYEGGRDIYHSYQLQKDNLEYISACAESGQKDITLYCFTPETKYSAYYDLKYLDTERSDYWPNPSFAKFFGLDSVVGYK